MKEITVNLWDDYLEGKPTSMYVEEDLPRATRIRLLKKILPTVKTFAKQAKGFKGKKIKATLCGQGKFNKTLNFVRGNGDPIIKLENLAYSNLTELTEYLNGKEWKDNFDFVLEKTKTYCFDLAVELLKDSAHFKRVESHFEDGSLLCTYQCSLDGRKYTVRVTPAER